ncbi:hypothetical protein HDU84_009866 [Entophlyctis sp. JEL0112]|nr:hypothetical protein HDU84_009866 [Entophlyctis sp. JEL0112]
MGTIIDNKDNAQEKSAITAARAAAAPASAPPSAPADPPALSGSQPQETSSSRGDRASKSSAEGGEVGYGGQCRDEENAANLAPPKAESTANSGAQPDIKQSDPILPSPASPSTGNRNAPASLSSDEERSNEAQSSSGSDSGRNSQVPSQQSPPSLSGRVSPTDISNLVNLVETLHLSNTPTSSPVKSAGRNANGKIHASFEDGGYAYDNGDSVFYASPEGHTSLRVRRSPQTPERRVEASGINSGGNRWTRFSDGSVRYDNKDGSVRWHQTEDWRLLGQLCVHCHHLSSYSFSPTDPNVAYCNDNLNNPKLHWYSVSVPDPCKPTLVSGTACVSGQCVYIADAQNFCINLPNPNSIYLKNNYYGAGALPTIVDAEGYVQSYCMGNYLPPGAIKFPANTIRSLNFVKNYTTTGQRYLQISGKFDCSLAGVNCTMSAPNTYDDGGQYDNGAWSSCGKEPYSGVDTTVTGLSTFPQYVMQASGNYDPLSGTPGYVNPLGAFCMRICEGGQGPGSPCDVTQDTKGCFVTMGVAQFPDTFTEQDVTNNANAAVTTLAITVPPLTTTAFVTATTAATVTATNGATVKTTTSNGVSTGVSLSLIAIGLGLLL